MVLIRTIQVSDAEQFLELRKTLDGETRFLMYEPGERRTTLAAQREQIQRILAKENDTILVAEQDGRLVGCLEAAGGVFRRDRHSVSINVAVLQAYAGQGICTKLFAELEAWACEQGVHRLELTVMAHNNRAMRLYEKMGFAREGVKRDSLLVDGSYVDEFYLAKLLVMPERSD